MDRKYQRCPQILGLILIVSIAFITAVAADKGAASSRFDTEISRKTSALDSIRVELEKGRAKLRQLEQQEGNYVGRLEQIERNITASQAYLNALSLKIDSVGKTIGMLQDSLGMAEKELKDRQTLMAKRIRNAYISGPNYKIQLLLSARSPMDAINRVRYLNDLTRYDRTLKRRIEESRDKIGDRKKKFEEQRLELSALITTKKEEQASLVSEEADRKKMLESVRQEKKKHLTMIAELEASQKEINKVIKMLESRRKKVKSADDKKATLAFEKRRGKLPWPLDGLVIGKYGKIVHPVYKTVTKNNGIDISPIHDNEVQCVASGTVVYVGSMRGLGKLVIVEHSGGYITVYAHLNDIDVAQDSKVEYGSVIGRVGSSGDSARLHFEIRKSSETLDPSEWLEKQARN